MPRLLAAIWNDRRQPAHERRRVLFDLWNECAEDGPEAVLAVSRQVRATIVAFVRERLPAGSPDAFTEDELTRWNRERVSREPFSPYD